MLAIRASTCFLFQGGQPFPLQRHQRIEGAKLRKDTLFLRSKFLELVFLAAYLRLYTLAFQARLVSFFIGSRRRREKTK